MNNFVDEFDDRIFHNGQVIGVKHGGSVHQPTITYSTIPNLGAGRLPDPGPRYGESRPPVIYDFTENPFYRAPRYGGGLNIPGAPGNIQKLPYYGGPLNPTTIPYDPERDDTGVELLAGAPRYIRGKFAPSGAIIKSPHLDSPYMDEQIRRGFRPMAPPPARPSGPQLFPLAQQLPMGFQNKFVS